MPDQIVSRETIRARAAFLAGRGRDSHQMNAGAAALTDWLAEYDRLDSERARDSDLELRRAVRLAKSSPASHFPAASFRRVEARQGLKC